VIKLSNVLQEYAPEKEVVCNVHGIRSDFLLTERPYQSIDEGKCTFDGIRLPHTVNSLGGGIYFIGKLLWAKGLDRLLELQVFFNRNTGAYFPMDIFGNGPDEREIKLAYLGAAEADEDSDMHDAPSSEADSRVLESCKEEMTCGTAFARSLNGSDTLPVRFLGRLDHGQVGPQYKVFVNPSVTEVLCTTTAEALAMGKFVVIPRHASNGFFEQFPNCLVYESKAEFVTQLQHAFANHPLPLSEELKHTLTWEAATDRLLDAASVSKRDFARGYRVGRKWDERATTVHYALGNGRTGDVLRKVLGGGPVADQFQYETSQRIR
jgi:digalactosyldiacylglycerol synthase